MEILESAQLNYLKATFIDLTCLQEGNKTLTLQISLLPPKHFDDLLQTHGMDAHGFTSFKAATATISQCFNRDTIMTPVIGELLFFHESRNLIKFRDCFFSRAPVEVGPFAECDTFFQEIANGLDHFPFLMTPILPEDTPLLQKQKYFFYKDVCLALYLELYQAHHKDPKRASAYYGQPFRDIVHLIHRTLIIKKLVSDQVDFKSVSEINAAIANDIRLDDNHFDSELEKTTAKVMQFLPRAVVLEILLHPVMEKAYPDLFNTVNTIK